MYIPEIYAEHNPEEIQDFIRQNALGILITQVQQVEPAITHLPFLLQKTESGFFLETHLASKNPHLEFLKNGKPSTLVFQGPNTYISSSLYSHENVPTWNYQAVHVHGTIELMSECELLTHLESSIDFFEDKRHKQVQFANLNKKMVAGFVKQITGIRLIPYKLEAKYKLSQNRNTTDYKAIVDDLEQSTALQDRLVAKVMQDKNPDKLK